MYRYLQLLLIGLLLASSAGAADLAPPQLEMEIPYGRLSLRQAQQQAIESSPGVAEAVARVEKAKAVVDQVRSTMLPQAGISLSRQWQDLSIQPDWAPEYRYNDAVKNFTAGVQVNWLLFDGFSRRASILAAQAQTMATVEATNEARRLLAEAVAGAYYQAQLAAEGMQIARQNQIFNRKLESDAQKRWRAGVIPEAEMLNFTVRALQAENDFLEARQNFELVCSVLAELMALPDARLSRDLYPCSSDSLGELDELPDYEDELDYALQQRPDLRALVASRDALHQQQTAARGSFYPKLSLAGGYQFEELTDTASVDQHERISYVGLNLNWELFSGGRRGAKLRETQADLLQLNHQQQQKVLEIQAGLRQGLVKAGAARAIYERQRYTLSLVQKIRDHIEKAYAAGSATLTRLNEAQTDLVRVSAAVAASRITYLQQLESLKATSGRILDELELPHQKVKLSGFVF